MDVLSLRAGSVLLVRDDAEPASVMERRLNGCWVWIRESRAGCLYYVLDPRARPHGEVLNTKPADASEDYPVVLCVDLQTCRQAQVAVHDCEVLA